ncbi:Ubiquitin system component Cue [Melia azedarach]|uniref:Ubiquitin system component Cue n=1 Tax=Melia azedarach TaxID=155640 RepID=A0ACC1XCK2_MELAZ|nr:Ubiquitin system component Cue [Melia azedarach]
MSAILCGKRSFFEDIAATSPPVTKRIRCSSSSPVRFSPPRSASVSNHSPFPAESHLIDQLAAIFPDMDKQHLEKALEECGDDLDSAIRSLNELRLGSAIKSELAAASKSDLAPETNAQGIAATNGEVPSTEDSSAPKVLQLDGPEWVELFVREMMSSSNIDDARARASRALEILEKSICARASAEAAQSFHQENKVLKEQVEALLQENMILKRAVAIQHERQKEYEERNHELHHLKQLVSQYQEQLRTLEVNNYALTMHLKQADQSNSIPGRFHPDVF